MYILPNEIQPTKIYAGCIAEFENIWPDSEKLIPQIEKEANSDWPFFQAGTYVKGNGTRSNKHLSITEYGFGNEFFKSVHNSFYLKVYAATRWYQKHYDLPEMQHAEYYNLLRYQTGQEYSAHYDGGVADNRCVSPILYLNDNYEGGELEFVHFGLKIKPKAGSLYLFPSNYAYSHIAHPVTEGTKYAIVTWLHGKI